MWRNTNRFLKPTLFVVSSTAAIFTGAALINYQRRQSSSLKNVRRRFGESERKPTIWDRFSPSTKITAAVVGINCAVFLCWKVRRLEPFMQRNFLHDPYSGLSRTLFTSMFSHSSPAHLAFNMLALSSFVPPVYLVLDREQFCAVYLTGGLFSAYFSHVIQRALKLRFVSLGASGALYTILVLFGHYYPHSQLSVIFLPMLSFSAENGIRALLAFDIIGATTGIFSFLGLNHYAHLGGALAAGVYLNGGGQLWAKRDALLSPLYSLIDVKKK